MAAPSAFCFCRIRLNRLGRNVTRRFKCIPPPCVRPFWPAVIRPLQAADMTTRTRRFPRTSCRKPLVVVVAGEQEVADPSGRYAGLPEPLAEDARVLFVAGIEQDVCSRPLRDGRSILSASAG